MKTSPAAQRTGGHRRVATKNTTGDLATRRGAGDPERRAEWMTVSRYGHLRSAPVPGGRCFHARSENRLHSLQPCGSPRASLGASLMASFLSSDLRNTSSPEGRERCRDAQTRLRSQESSEWFRRWVQKFVTSRGLDQSQSDGFSGCPLLANTSLRAAHVIAPPLFQQVTGASRRVHESDRQFSRRNRSRKKALFSLLSKLVGYLVVSQSCLPPVSGARVIPCETQTLWWCAPLFWFLGFSSLLRP